MATPPVQTFIHALRALERDGQLAPLVSCFSDRCEVRNANSPRVFRGTEGAETFWREYRAAFLRLDSRFDAIIEAGRRAAIQWTSEGEAPNGGPIRYEGVSVLEFDDEGRVQRFDAYFNPLPLVRALHANVSGAV